MVMMMVMIMDGRLMMNTAEAIFKDTGVCTR